MTPKPSAVLSSETHRLISAAGHEHRIAFALPHAYDAAPDDAWPFNDVP